MVASKKRFIYMVIAGTIIGYIMETIIPPSNPNHPRIFNYLTCIGITILVWEGNKIIDALLNKRLPWMGRTAYRIVVQLVISILYSTAAIYMSMIFLDRFVCPMPYSNRQSFTIVSIILGLLITLIIMSMEIGAQFFTNWKKSLVEVERYKAESVQAQLQNLKEQVNPHFLFNNLSVLSSLVYKDQDKAVDFINQLSKVYRYLLDTRNSELITLEEELRFISSYTFLLQIRFDKNISFKLDIPQNKRHLLLPPMALQLLIENTIKHNEVSNDMPLNVRIEEHDSVLIVQNNLQRRSNREESSKTGLNNIRQRYKHYTTRAVEVLDDGKNFVVKIPLLQKA